MHTLHLGITFDVVLAYDAIDCMTTEDKPRVSAAGAEPAERRPT